MIGVEAVRHMTTTTTTTKRYVFLSFVVEEEEEEEEPLREQWILNYANVIKGQSTMTYRRIPKEGLAVTYR